MENIFINKNDLNATLEKYREKKTYPTAYLSLAEILLAKDDFLNKTPIDEVINIPIQYDLYNLLSNIPTKFDIFIYLKKENDNYVISGTQDIDSFNGVRFIINRNNNISINEDDDTKEISRKIKFFSDRRFDRYLICGTDNKKVLKAMRTFIDNYILMCEKEGIEGIEGSVAYKNLLSKLKTNPLSKFISEEETFITDKVFNEIIELENHGLFFSLKLI